MAATARVNEEQFFDPLWRLNNLYTIVDERGQRVPFRLNTAQQQLAADMHGMDIILKARQLGFTTFYCIFMLDACVFYNDISAGVIAHNLKDAKAFFENKVQFPYDHLDEGIRAANPLVKDAADVLSLKNGSSLRVGTSLRSGTFQYLLISEYGKICAKFPEKAKEVRTGALNTIQPGQHVCIESTAEGREGHFFNLTKAARNRQTLGLPLRQMDFKFHFFPWFEDPKYIADPTDVNITDKMATYFDKLETDLDIKLSPEQRAWYVLKEDQQEDEMSREFPSTPDEAFAAAVQGSYLAKQMTKVRQQKRICRVPVETALPVNTFWDLGTNDNMTIWFHQQFQQEHRFVNYMEGCGEGFAFYKREMERWADDYDITWGKHFGPHDIEVTNLTDKAETRKDAAARIGLHFETVPAPHVKMDGINAVREVLPLCWFDEAACEKGISHLDMFRKKWSEKLGAFLSEHEHDDASHGFDGFQTFALAKQADTIDEEDEYVDTYGSGGGSGWMRS